MIDTVRPRTVWHDSFRNVERRARHSRSLPDVFPEVGLERLVGSRFDDIQICLRACRRRLWRAGIERAARPSFKHEEEQARRQRDDRLDASKSQHSPPPRSAQAIKPRQAYVARPKRLTAGGEGGARPEGFPVGPYADRLSISRTVATSSPRGTARWPGRWASHSRRASTFLASSRPTSISLRVTMPRSFSVDP